MDLREKKGFITIYVMLAMMFFVVFVVTASVTASRKIKLQTEANSALYEIYSEDIEHIVQNTTNIPIYTKEQFLQILNWLEIDDSSKISEYMYINDVVYTLDASRYNGEASYKNSHPEHSFILKTDIWLEGIENSGDDKDEYPFIPTTIHEIYKEIKGKIDKSGHNIYLQVGSNMYVYDVEEIQIATAEDFLKIGTGELLSNGIPATSNLNYRIVKSIEIPDGMTRNNITVDFSGTINGDDKIISGLKLQKSFFDTNSGTIENLTFVNVSSANVEKEDNGNIKRDDDGMISGETIIKIDGYFGIITGTNLGTINDCNIMLKKNDDTGIIPNVIDKIECYSLGGMVGKNTGTISNCNIQGIEISECSASNIGGVVGVNEGTISNITVNGKIQINSSGAYTIGGICGWNYKDSECKGKIEKILISSNINIHDINNVADYNVGGIVGRNSAEILNVLIDGQPEEGKENYGNISITISDKSEINSNAYEDNIGGVAGTNLYKIENCIVNGNIVIDKELNMTNIGGIVGGIVGELIDSSECSISNCYSNVKLESDVIVKSIGGIVGYLDNGIINNCPYVNQITSTSNIPIGGIVGLLNAKNSPIITNCYMNGVIPTNSKSGAVIGTIEGTEGTINAGTDGTSDDPVYYNQAFRWIGYASTLTGITLNYNCAAESSDDAEFLNRINNLKNLILNTVNPTN